MNSRRVYLAPLFFLVVPFGFAQGVETPPTPLQPPGVRRFVGLWNQDASPWERPLPTRAPTTRAYPAEGKSSGGADLKPSLPSVESFPRAPGFRMRPTMPAGYVPTSSAGADFNRDGRPDLAVANGLENTLWLYLGSHGGGFEPPVIIALKGESPVSLEAVDLQDDGFTDLVLCTVDSATVTVLLGKGNGEFSEDWTYPVYAHCSSTVSRDFDGDGAVDIAVGFSSSYYGEVGKSFNILDALGLLKGKGDGTFRPLQFERAVQFYSADRLLAADLDGDSDHDLVVVSTLDGVFPFFNDGRGKFTRGPAIQYGPPDNPVTSAAVGDLDSDGCLDLALVYLAGQVVRLRGACNGTFRLQADWHSTGEKSLVSELRDFDGDGALDLVVTGSRLAVMKGDGRGGFGHARVFRGEPWMVDLTAGDFDLDGDLDLISINQTTDTLTLFQNDGDADFGAPRGIETSGSSIYGGVVSPGALRFGDVNRDGRLDAVYVEEGQVGLPHRISTLLVGADGRFGEPIRSLTFREPFIGGFALGDFRNTGRLDLVAVGQYEQFVPGSTFLAFAPGNGDGSFGATRLTRPEGANGMLVLGDFNRDGRLDLATAGNESSTSYRLRVTLFFGNGDGTFTAGSRMIFGGGGWPGAFHAADFNRDGNLDLLVWAYDNTVPYQDNGLYQLLGKGDGTFQPARKLYDLFRPFTVIDLNGDGLPDLVTSKDFVTDYPEPTRVEFEIFLCRGDGTFRKAHTYNPVDATTQFPLLQYGITNSYDFFAPRTGDFNGDGFIDIAAFHSEEGGHAAVQFLLGRGDGSFVTAYNRISFGSVQAPQIALDLDGDGYADLIEIGLSEVDVLPGGPGPSFEFELTPPQVLGTRGYGTVQLSVPSGQTTEFSLSSSSPNIRVPARLEVPAGRLSARFPIDISAGHDWHRIFDVVVSREGEQKVGRGRQQTPRVFYFPQVADGEENRTRLRTSLVFINTADNARARVEFFDSDSNPVALNLEGLGPKSVLHVSLRKGASASFETAGIGPLQAGYARVTVFGSIGGAAVFSGSDALGGEVLFEAGVPLTKTEFSATVPVATQRGYDTGIAIVNSANLETPPDQGEARLDIRFYDQHFEPLQEERVDLQAGRHLARFVSQILDQADIVDQAPASITIESDQPLAVIALRQHLSAGPSPPILTAFPVVAGRADGPIFDSNNLIPRHHYVPHIGDGLAGGIRFQTSFVLMNTGIDSGVNIDFFDSSGRPMALELVGYGRASRFHFPLWQGETLTLQTAGTGPIRNGYARIQALAKVTGTAIFTGSEAVGGRLLYEAGIPFSSPVADFTLFVDSLGARNTGLALANAAPSEVQGEAAVLDLRLYDLSFRLLAQTTVSLPFGSHLARYVHQLFPEFAAAGEMQGLLTVGSNQPVLAVTLRQNYDPQKPQERPTLTAFPVVVGRADRR